MNIHVSDVVYRTGEQPLLARIYRPAGEGPFPAIISVHGGGWLTNDRTSNQPLDEALASQGILVVAIDFRMPPGSPYPASIQDINYAVRWLKAHASTFGTRPNLVGGLGSSSGGQQLSLMALRSSDPRYCDLPLEGGAVEDSSLAYMALCWPVVDPHSRYLMAKAQGIRDMIEPQEAYFGTEVSMKNADSLLCLESGQPVNLPPTLIIQAGADKRLNPGSLERFEKAYTRRGGKAIREVFEDQGHAFIVLDATSRASQRAIRRIATFIHEQTAEQFAANGGIYP